MLRELGRQAAMDLQICFPSMPQHVSLLTALISLNAVLSIRFRFVKMDPDPIYWFFNKWKYVLIFSLPLFLCYYLMKHLEIRKFSIISHFSFFNKFWWIFCSLMRIRVFAYSCWILCTVRIMFLILVLSFWNALQCKVWRILDLSALL